MWASVYTHAQWKTTKENKHHTTAKKSTVWFVVSEEEFVRSKQILIKNTDSDDFDDVQNMQKQL